MNWLVISAINLAAGVALGAFGAHGLKQYAGSYAIDIWHTATLYLFIHALGLFGIGILTHLTSHQLNRPAIIMQLGIILFSGSLYAMALGAPKWLGAITPLGGVLFIISWLIFALTISRIKN